MLMFLLWPVFFQFPMIAMQIATDDILERM